MEFQSDRNRFLRTPAQSYKILLSSLLPFGGRKLFVLDVSFLSSVILQLRMDFWSYVALNPIWKDFIYNVVGIPVSYLKVPLLWQRGMNTEYHVKHDNMRSKQIFKLIATCSRRFLARGFFYHEDGGDTFLRNVGSHNIYTALLPRRRHSS
jgi:hypothetical protein